MVRTDDFVLGPKQRARNGRAGILELTLCIGLTCLDGTDDQFNAWTVN